jgi:MFS family permease
MAPLEPPTDELRRPEPRSLWRNSAFQLFVAVRALTSLAFEIVTVAVGWWVYDISRDPFDLGLIGLTQVMPALTLVLVTGAAADRFPRNWIVGASLFFATFCSMGLLALSAGGDQHLAPIFAAMVLLGCCRAFFSAAQQAMLPNLVARQQLPRAISSTVTIFKLGAVIGPMAGGLLYGLSPAAAFAVASGAFLAASTCAFAIPRIAVAARGDTPRSLLAGLAYIRNQKVLLGAMSLDMVAVLLGGAMALLPVFARDILDAGPFGLGLLRSAFAVGAIATAAYLSWRPVRDNVGRWMFFAVGGFGALTVVFGLSESVWLSTLALAGMGAIDMIGVTIRQTIVQLWTPDEMRGRVSAANSVFISVSNEAGEFRAGTVAALIGTVPAVVIGGIGTLVAAALWARWFPELLKVRHLDR